LLRITGGELGGRRFKAPPGEETRPTADRVKEALFAVLGGRARVDLAADLFAGSGGLGMEALSRGAGRCLFVEKRRGALKALRRNLESLGLDQRAEVLMTDAAAPSRRLLARGPCGLILADPPYEKGFAARVGRLAGERGFLAPDGWLVVEHSPRERLESGGGLVLEDRRAYGQTEISFLHREP
jgi:16S rRNA (guanine966-N2)-methyltransferase